VSSRVLKRNPKKIKKTKGAEKVLKTQEKEKKKK